MSGLANFRQRHMELQGRLRRLAHVSPKALVRRRVERQLRELVAEELRAEAEAPLRKVPEYPEEEGHELTWFQK